MPIRVSAKAFLLHEGKILMNKNDDGRGICYTFPGGGQHQYETMEEAVLRECMEETGYRVRVERFAALYEEIAVSEIHRLRFAEHSHKIYHFFVCRLAGGERGAPTEMDENQLTSEWIDIDRLGELTIGPKAVGARVSEILRGDAPVFIASSRVEMIESM